MLYRMSRENSCGNFGDTLIRIQQIVLMAIS